uniref:Uncharacterized protein n=1 Tax=Arundo donax TaxID=35708 RepID=A0A0A8Y215_ARUDO
MFRKLRLLALLFLLKSGQWDRIRVNCAMLWLHIFRERGFFTFCNRNSCP